MLSTGTIGYQHDFQNSLLGAYYDEDLAYISWTQLIWRFTGFVRAQYTNMRFKGVQAIQATTDGTDNNFMLNLRVDYPFKDWLIAQSGYDFILNRTDRSSDRAPDRRRRPSCPSDYTKNVVYLRVTLSILRTVRLEPACCWLRSGRRAGRRTVRRRATAAPVPSTRHSASATRFEVRVFGEPDLSGTYQGRRRGQHQLSRSSG